MLSRTMHRVTQRHYPSERLAAIREMRAELRQLERDIVLEMRAAGFSWDEIALPMGITRQALQRKAETWKAAP